MILVDKGQSPLGVLVPLGRLCPGGLTLVPPIVWSAAPSSAPRGALTSALLPHRTPDPGPSGICHSPPLCREPGTLLPLTCCAQKKPGVTLGERHLFRPPSCLRLWGASLQLRETLPQGQHLETLNGGCGPWSQPGQGREVKGRQERQRAQMVGRDGETALSVSPSEERQVMSDRV